MAHPKAPGKPNPRHLSQTTEHGTPSDIIESARALMGGIDLDPASDALFNTVVKAETYFTEQDNGFTRPWHGRVLLNPPGGLCDDVGKRILMSKGHGYVYPDGKPALSHHSAMAWWWIKLMHELKNLHEAIFIGFSIELFQRVQSVISRYQTSKWIRYPTDFPFCVPTERIPFLKKEGNKVVQSKAPTHANAISFVCTGDDRKQAFKLHFSRYGAVVIPS